MNNLTYIDIQLKKIEQIFINIPLEKYNQIQRVLEDTFKKGFEKGQESQSDKDYDAGYKDGKLDGYDAGYYNQEV